MGLHKLAVEKVEIVNLRIDTLGRDIVKENREIAHPEVIHLLKLRQSLGAVGLALYGVARVHGPHEFHLVGRRVLHELGHFGRLVGGIGVKPLAVVVGVILRAVDIHIETVTTVEIKLAQAVGVAPGVAVEALDHSAHSYHGSHGGVDCRSRIFQKLLHAVEGSSLVATRYHHFFRAYAQVEAFGSSRYLRGIFLHGLIAGLADYQLHGSLRINCHCRAEQLNSVGISCFVAYELIGGSLRRSAGGQNHGQGKISEFHCEHKRVTSQSYNIFPYPTTLTSDKL